VEDGGAYVTTIVVVQCGKDCSDVSAASAKDGDYITAISAPCTKDDSYVVVAAQPSQIREALKNKII
jgi:hypothetical protein